jgi:hypothetical protein
METPSPVFRTPVFLHAASSAVLAFVLALPVSAEDVLPAVPLKYDVELVVFRSVSPNATPENWAAEQALAGRHVQQDADDESGAPAVADRSSREISVTAVPGDRFKLGGIEEALRRSHEYQPVAHFGWTQVGYPLNAAPQVDLDALLPQGSALSGKASLSRGRYLHLTLNLSFQPPGGSPRYFLQQGRRMRSNEKHYFDHPQFGVIAIVTPQTN